MSKDEKNQTKINEARELIKREQESKVRGCGEEIKVVLEKYGCDLAVKNQLSPDNRIISEINIYVKQ